MAVFTTTEAQEAFKNVLREVYKRNEAQPNKWYEFSRSPLGNSGYSFGQAQWDVTGSPDARAFLSTLVDGGGIRVFGDADIEKLRAQTATQAEIDTFNARLSDQTVRNQIDQRFEAHLNNDVRLIENLVSELYAAGRTQAADYVSANPLAQMLLVDYNNQFPNGIEGVDGYSPSTTDGFMMRYLKGEKVTPWTEAVQTDGSFDIGDITRFTHNTKYYLDSIDGALDIARRFLNTLNVAKENSLLNCTAEEELQLRNSVTDAALFSDSISVLEQSVLDFESAEATVVSPIILDLDGDGVETIGVNGGAYFDHDGNGFAESTGWVGADDGLLVWDRNGDGRINDGKELFGSETLLANGTKAANGYQALSELDTNADGKVDVNDAAFASLKVWKDLDGDGYSATGELFSLADVGVQSINTGATASSYVDPNGNAHKLTGTFTRTNGTVGNTADVWFQTNKLYTIQEEYLNVPMAIAALPDLRGYGNVYDLQQAMVRDGSGSLKALVEQFVAESNPGTRNQLFEQILFKWSGSDTIDPASRGSYIDARRLAFLEKVFAQSYVGSNGSPNPAYNTAPLLRTPNKMRNRFYTSWYRHGPQGGPECHDRWSTIDYGT